MKNFILILFITIGLTSCYYDSKEAITPQDLTNLCDTSTVTYSGIVSDIMTTSCSTSGCHIGSLPAAGIAYDNYVTVKAYVDNGHLMGTIKQSAGFSAMPKGAQKLSDCQIAHLDAWINAGALNN